MGEEQQEPIGFRWDQDRRQENERFRDVLNKTDFREKLFGDKFIEALQKRHDALGERLRKATLVTGLALLLLAIALLAVQVPVSLFGVSASNAGNLREILLVLLASSPLYTLFSSIEQSRIADAMKTWIERASRGDKDVERVLMLRFGLGVPFNLQKMDAASMPKWRAMRVVGMAVGGLLWLVLSIGAVVLLEMWGLVSILHQPTVSTGFSVMMVLYTIFAACVSYGMRLAGGILSQADQSRN